jgi:hypothetical protein
VKCWRCDAENPDGADFCTRCKCDLTVAPSNPYASPQTGAAPKPAEGGDATGGLIPYKNPKALIAYYLGILSGLPFIGLPIGIAAFILGFMGLRDRKRNPVIKGSIHAGIGIGCGCLFSLLWTVFIVGIIISMMATNKRGWGH